MFNKFLLVVCLSGFIISELISNAHSTEDELWKYEYLTQGSPPGEQLSFELYRPKRESPSNSSVSYAEDTKSVAIVKEPKGDLGTVKKIVRNNNNITVTTKDAPVIVVAKTLPPVPVTEKASTNYTVTNANITDPYANISTIIHTGNISTPILQVNHTIPKNVTDMKFQTEITNITLQEHNITRQIEDSHVYYNSSRFEDSKTWSHYWVDFHKMSNATRNDLLSQSHRKAVTIPLGFKFPFYGHEIDNVTVASGGFLYTGDYIHSWLAATQYIAPLMANFDTGLFNESSIRYVGNGTAFTVLWENVALKDDPTAGNFTFQTTLHKNGDIIFAYEMLPDITPYLKEDYHPVKIGLSDAFILDKTIFFIRKKMIFEYHRVNFDKKELKNGTVIYLKPLPTCHTKTTCTSCLTKETTFDCQWCDNRCSNGFDRKRHEWISRQCDKRRINETKNCASASTVIARARQAEPYNSGGTKPTSNSSAISILVVAVSSICSIFIWSIYAYRNPHTTSGQILIKYRPSQWSSWRKGEARYTAATIHM